MKAKICFNNEIHKVSNLPGNFEGLRQLVAKIFQDKLPEFINLQYLDSDGDKILISDEKDFEEFKSYVSQYKNGTSVVKIFIAPNEFQISSKIINDKSAKKSEEDYQIVEKLVEVEESLSNEKIELEVQKEESKERNEKKEKFDQLEKENEKGVDESVIEEAKEDSSFSVASLDERSFQSGNNKVLVDMSTLEQLMSSMLVKSLPKIVQATKEEASKAFKKENQENKVVHYGVRCSGCKVPSIVGVRYKCSVCYNFNYCEKCEETIEHAHNFIKMKERNVFENIKPNFPQKPGGCFFPPKKNYYQNKNKHPKFIFGEENDYFRDLKEKAEKLQKCFPKAEFEMLMVYLNEVPADLSFDELVENYKH